MDKFRTDETSLKHTITRFEDDKKNAFQFS